MERRRKFWRLSPIESIVTVIILGILGAIALPSLLLQKVCACQEPEPLNYLGVMSRAQRAYALEYEHFATAMTDLGIGIPEQTENYNYSLHTTPLYAIHYATPRKGKSPQVDAIDWSKGKEILCFQNIIWCIPLGNWQKKDEIKPIFKGYASMVVFVSGNLDTQEVQTAHLICETRKPTLKRPPKPIFKNNTLMCPTGTKGYRNKKSPGIKIRDRDWQLAYQSFNLAETGERDRALQLANTIKDTKVEEKVLGAIAAVEK
ncbi:hypothetical protein IQ249_17760 [Lusitaniella coriacea LEGE 07157]|uniref:Prepilin-type N-terminal cleavage/methylation domain-containing protein n=1 Tax=Lusitaniella coriacea LEGE 07157 TaxID=945747 RepID=A0A8J7DYR8_9CYAN|nr:type IV pilin-like G/H family protein [Lusitaniella coriacea]MBE9117747.1 hypothetical protein [Lusitaniella coriacea LEGE 07157]